jgi:PQQ-like domain
VKRRAAVGATTAVNPPSAPDEMCTKTTECCQNYYMGRTWRDGQSRDRCEAELEFFGRECKAIADVPGDACQKDAACMVQKECKFAGSPEGYCKDRLDYYRGQNGGSCELIEPPKPIEIARTVEPTTGRFTVGPRFPMFARDATGATVDPLVWGRSGQQSCLARFDARAGASTWINCAYGPVTTQLNRSAVIGDRVLVDFERNLDALDAKSGAKLWTTRLDERTMELCLGPDGTLRVVIEGGDTYVVAQETGKLTPSKRTYDCLLMASSIRRFLPLTS